MAALQNHRTINIDALDPDSPLNFPMSSLHPSVIPGSQDLASVQSTVTQIRQLLRSGDSASALLGALDTAPYGADDKGKEAHAAVVVEVLQSIRQAEMTPLLKQMYEGERGTEKCDTLMKYLYKGMGQSSVTAAQSNGPGGRQSGSNLTPQSTGFSQMGGRSFGGGAGAAEGGAQAMSVLLSWHEKLVDIAGLGCIVRCLTDRRTV